MLCFHYNIYCISKLPNLYFIRISRRYFSSNYKHPCLLAMSAKPNVHKRSCQINFMIFSFIKNIFIFSFSLNLIALIHLYHSIMISYFE